jgi:glycosyltransferase involved in cell wall biosynthesis
VPFLAARIASIEAQALTDWEVVALDGCSTDGSWEQVVAWAERDRRVRAEQAAPEGIYPAFNRCIGMARGTFIYIATSDDTMAPDCLEKLVGALEAHPECDLAHCTLRAEGSGAERMNAWWGRSSLFARSSQELLNRPHIRRAPFDGLLHLNGGTVYISLTQLLVRKSLFDRIGLFEGRWGSIGDFHWGMRASLVANTVHVPDTWGGWRLHSAQASHSVVIGSPEHRQKIEEMIDDALARSWSSIPSPVQKGLREGWRDYFRSTPRLLTAFNSKRSRLERMAFLGARLALLDSTAWGYARWRLAGSGAWREEVPGVVRDWLQSVGFSQPLVGGGADEDTLLAGKGPPFPATSGGAQRT